MKKKKKRCYCRDITGVNKTHDKSEKKPNILSPVISGKREEDELLTCTKGISQNVNRGTNSITESKVCETR